MLPGSRSGELRFTCPRCSTRSRCCARGARSCAASSARPTNAASARIARAIARGAARRRERRARRAARRSPTPTPRGSRRVRPCSKRRCSGCRRSRSTSSRRSWSSTGAAHDHGTASSRCRISCSSARSSRSFCKRRRRRSASPTRSSACCAIRRQQYAQFAELRAALGPPDALERCARVRRRARASAGSARDPHLSHVGSARPPRHRRRAARAARRSSPGLLFDCGDSLRGSQTVYHRDEPIVARDRCGRLRRAGDRQPRVPLSLSAAARARGTHAPSARLHEPARHQGPRRCRSSPSLRVRSANGVRIHVLGLLIMQYPAGSPWERVFGWRFLDPWDAVEPYARSDTRRATCWSCSRTSACRSIASSRSACRASICCSAATATTRSSNPSTSAACRSSTPARTAATSRARELDVRRARRALRDRDFRARCRCCRSAVMRVLFVSNGHGEAAIADRIAAEAARARAAMRDSIISRWSARVRREHDARRRAAARDAERRLDRDGKRAQHRARRPRRTARR